MLDANPGEFSLPGFFMNDFKLDLLAKPANTVHGQPELAQGCIRFYCAEPRLLMRLELKTWWSCFPADAMAVMTTTTFQEDLKR